MKIQPHTTFRKRLVFRISFTECAGFSTECAKPVYRKKIIIYYDAIVVSGKCFAFEEKTPKDSQNCCHVFYNCSDWNMYRFAFGMFVTLHNIYSIVYNNA